METPQLKIQDLVDFIFLNKGKTFVGYDTKDKIALLVSNHIQDGSIFYTTNQQGKIIGMILAEIDHEKKIVFVTENLSMSLPTLRLFAAKAKLNWPDYQLKWMKHGIYKHHNTDKVYKKLVLV